MYTYMYTPFPHFTICLSVQWKPILQRMCWLTESTCRSPMAEAESRRLATSSDIKARFIGRKHLKKKCWQDLFRCDGKTLNYSSCKRWRTILQSKSFSPWHFLNSSTNTTVPLQFNFLVIWWSLALSVLTIHGHRGASPLDYLVRGIRNQ